MIINSHRVRTNDCTMEDNSLGSQFLNYKKLVTGATGY